MRRIFIGLCVFVFVLDSFVLADSPKPFESSSLALNVDTFSGSASTSIAIAVAEGRAGISPNINLSYNSNLRNGILGVGWNLELGSIQRSTKKGAPKYDSTDSYVFVSSSDVKDLVYNQSGNYYRARQESDFTKFEKQGQFWVLTDTKGTKYYFGETSAARQYDPSSPDKVFSWAINRVEDIFGNNMTVSYLSDGNKLIPQEINYTGNSKTGAQPYAKVIFETISRSDAIVSYITGFEVKTFKKISGVKVYAGGQMLRWYKLTYSTSPVTGRSLITKVEEVVSDGVSVLPATTFEYKNLTAPTYETVAINSNKQIAADFNADGQTDLASYIDGQWDVMVSLGDTFANARTWITGFGYDPDTPYMIVPLLGDFNYDGKMDISYLHRANCDVKVALSTGSAFANQGYWLNGFGTFYDDYYSADIDMDGRSDFVKRYSISGSDANNYKFALSSGSAFIPNSAITDAATTPGWMGPNFLDMNSDGLVDVVINDGAQGRWAIYLNTGKLENRFKEIVSVTSFGANNKKIVYGDFNQDGFVDLGYYDYSRGVIVYKLFDGTNLGQSQDLPVAFDLKTDNTNIQVADFNGDNIYDYLIYDLAGTVKVVRSNNSNPEPPDILKSFTNGFGAKSTIEYVSSVLISGTFLPFSIPVVKSITLSDNSGSSYRTQYEYTEGKWDFEEKEFMGFRTVKERKPSGSYEEITYIQQLPYRGMVSKKALYHANNSLASMTLFSVDHITMPNTTSKFAFYTVKDNFIYDGVGKRTQEKYFYQNTPESVFLAKSLQLGEVDLNTGADIGNDDRSVEYSYFNNVSTGNWLIGLPKDIKYYNENNELIRQSWFAYDGGDKATLPTKGLVTKKEEWDQRAVVNPVVSFAYDLNYGNLISTTDSKNSVSAITYDTQFNLFPVKTKNVKGHEVINQYYGVDGIALDLGNGYKGLWGQLKSSTDPNKQKGEQSYDVFGRAIKSVNALDSISFPTVSMSYQLNTNYVKKTTSLLKEHGQAQTLDTHEFYDGLGRVIQIKSPSKVVGQYIVSGQSVYNNQGQPVKKFVPFFSTNTLDTIESIDNTRAYTSIEYDDLGRVIKTINPDGTYSTIIYESWKTSTINENGHKSVSVFDAYGRLIEKQEYVGADGRSPYHLVAPYTLYASTKYYYNFDGNLIKVEDAQGNVTIIAYDNLGRKTAINDPDFGQWSYEYDSLGNLVKQIDAKGQTIDFTYDSLNRLVNKTDHALLNVNYTFDDVLSANSVGRLSKAQYASEYSSFSYDPTGQETQSNKYIGSKNFQFNRAYNALNGLNSIQFPDAKAVIYQYNPAGAIGSVVGQVGI